MSIIKPEDFSFLKFCILSLFSDNYQGHNFQTILKKTEIEVVIINRKNGMSWFDILTKALEELQTVKAIREVNGLFFLEEYSTFIERGNLFKTYVVDILNSCDQNVVSATELSERIDMTWLVCVGFEPTAVVIAQYIQIKLNEMVSQSVLEKDHGVDALYKLSSSKTKTAHSPYVQGKIMTTNQQQDKSVLRIAVLSLFDTVDKVMIADDIMKALMTPGFIFIGEMPNWFAHAGTFYRDYLQPLVENGDLQVFPGIDPLDPEKVVVGLTTALKLKDVEQLMQEQDYKNRIMFLVQNFPGSTPRFIAREFTVWPLWFKNRGIPWSTDISNIYALRLMTEMVKSGRLDVVEVHNKPWDMVYKVSEEAPAITGIDVALRVMSADPMSQIELQDLYGSFFNYIKREGKARAAALVMSNRDALIALEQRHCIRRTDIAEGLLQQLVNDGIIIVEDSQEDRNSWRWQLTAKGMTMPMCVKETSVNESKVILSAPATAAIIEKGDAHELQRQFNQALEIIALDFINQEIRELEIADPIDGLSSPQVSILKRLRGAILDHALTFRLSKPKDNNFGVPNEICKVQLVQTEYPMDACLLAPIVDLYVNEGH